MKFELQVKITYSFEDLHKAISVHLNDLIVHDFSRLISLLYRLDIPEKKLHDTLHSATGITTSDIIADMIIQRQIQKIETRSRYNATNTDCDEEKW